MRAPVDHIAAPPFPPKLRWINVAMLRMDQQLGRPVLIEFWDFCRPNSIRTLPYIKAWHERYVQHGLRVIGVHTAGFEPSMNPDAVEAACRRLGISYAVAVDSEQEVWESYGNVGWPARYLFDQHGMLFEHHYGEGAYEETELAIQELLDVQLPTIEPLRPEDVPGVVLEPQTADVEGPYSGRYRAGAVWAVLSGAGSVTVGTRRIAVEHQGCYELIRHPHSTEGVLELELGAGVRCHAVCFTPGVRAGARRRPED